MNDIKTMLEVLREARHLIDLYAKRDMCSAIHAASGEEWATTDPRRIRAGRYLRRWVLAMISPHYSLIVWLEERRGIPTYVMHKENPKLVREKLRVTRLAWIDWMIGELEKDLK